MAESQPFQPDDVYCAYCHAPAAGRCASCRAIVCADCAELLTGAGGKSWAVCKDCHDEGPGTLGRLFGDLAGAALPFLAAAAILAILWWTFAR